MKKDNWMIHVDALPEHHDKIKLFRDLSGMGLGESRDLVNAIIAIDELGYHTLAVRTPAEGFPVGLPLKRDMTFRGTEGMRTFCLLWQHCPTLEVFLRLTSLHRRDANDIAYRCRRAMVPLKRFGRQPIDWDEVRSDIADEPVERCLPVVRNLPGQGRREPDGHGLHND